MCVRVCVCVCVLPVSRELPVEEEIIQTQLHSRTSDEYYTYSNVPWKLYMRKEVCFQQKATGEKSNSQPLQQERTLCVWGACSTN